MLPTAGWAQGAKPLPRVELKPGLVLTHSARIVPRRYRLAAPASLDSALLVIRGNDLTIELTGVQLVGQDAGADPDAAAGVAIRIDGGRNVRVRGGMLSGYKVGVLARGTRGLTLSNLDASHNWKPRLYSLIEHESLVDWLSFHHNEQGEWLRYGAGIYLDGVRHGSVRGNRAEQGMNGLLLVRSDSLQILENDFSFNSGLGIGLYRSSDNTIVRNRLDYNVRGYSHGFYRRGQDSADLLLFEQSSRNLVAYNSATHGGDGLFLWAGQSTMDTGQGGANDNLFYGNDFSFAPANAMEATFSRNRFIGNRAAGSDYGLWGGYSFESPIAGNCFLGNRIGIAIEHGQDNVISGNRFRDDSTAIQLWGDPIEPSDWGYPKHRDTKSRGYRIAGNSFERNRVALRARNTDGLQVSGNRYEGVDSVAVVDSVGRADGRTVGRKDGKTEGRKDGKAGCGASASLPAEYARGVPRLPAVPRSVPASALSRLDRSAIVVDEWGPYDWRTPRLWPLDSSRAVPLRLRTLGPAGGWRVASRRGVATLSAESGKIGDTISVTPAPDSAGDWALTLEYRGTRRTGFGYSRFEPRQRWQARFVAWRDSSEIQSDSGLARLFRGVPLLTRELSRLDFEGYRAPLPGVPRERWALEASTALTLPRGGYRLRTISDDGIRVWLDGRLVIDRWNVHESTVDEVVLGPGSHDLRVQYFQGDGWSELRVELLREPRA